MNILIVCNSGMSSTILERSLIQAIQAEDLDWKVEACSLDFLEKWIPDYDVVLYGPQIRYREKGILNLCSSYNKRCEMIHPQHYALGAGHNVLKQLKRMLKEDPKG